MKQKLVTKGKTGVSVSPSLDNVRFRLMVFLASVLSLLFITQAEIIAAGQVQKISVHTNGHEPLTSVFRTIEKSSIYLFNYQDKDVAGIKVSVSIDNATVEEVMASVLKGTELAWQIKGKNIIVSVSRQQASGSRREVTIRGKVIDSDGQPVPGVGVLERDGKNGTVTDIDGNYSLPTTKGVVLIYSCIGYKDCTAVVGTSDVINMTLNAEDIQLDEAVVTALGIRKSEKSLGYSIQQVNAEAFSKVKTDNPLNMLNGKIAGLTLNTRAAILEDPAVHLRGESPIYVVNGTPVKYYRGISNDDIESITVLKGPQAAVLYGARGANGAILITTKSGTADNKDVDINVNSSTMFTAGYLTLPDQQTIYGTGEYGRYAYKDGKGGGLYDGLWTWGPKLDQKDPLSPSGIWETVQYNSPIDPETGERIPLPFVSHKNNFKNFLQEGLVTDNNVSVAKKFNGGSFRVSLNQMYRRGQTPNTNLKKFGITAAANYDITKKLHINMNMIYSYTYSKNRPWSGYGNQHPYYNILVYMGTNNDILDLKDYWEEGQVGYAQRNWNHTWFNNPWFVAYEFTRPYSEPELIASASLDYDIIDGLNFMVKVATDSKHQNQEECKPYAWVGNDNGCYSVSSDRNVDVNIDAMLSYKKKFGWFDVDAMVGASVYDSMRNYQWASTDGGLLQPDLYNVTNSTNSPKVTTTIQRRRMEGVFGTATFGALNAIFLTFTGRNDWSSTLNPDNNSFFYPSVSLSGVMTSLINLPKAISFWKVRGSWAKVGFDQSSVYLLENSYSFNKYWGNNASMTPPTLVIDKGIKPYFTNSLEIGTDIRFFDNRLRLDFSYYRTKDEGQIQQVDINQSSGYSKLLTNGNDYRRKGYEVILGTVPVRTRDWEWKMDMNWSLTRKYLDRIYNGAYTYNNLKVGDRADAIYAQVWQRDPEGNFIVYENNGRPIEDPYKRIIGYSGPDWEFGISSSLRWRKWTMSFDISGRVGGVIRSDLNSRMIEAGTHKKTAVPERELDWTQKPSFIPSNAVIVTGGEVTYDDHGNVVSDTRTFAPSSTPVYFKSWIGYLGKLNGPYTLGYNLYKADFIKLRNLSISYDFSSLIKKNKVVKGLELSLIGNNLFIWKKLDNEDPDAAFKTFSYPTERMVGFNLSISL